jgi:hypothetical protein
MGIKGGYGNPIVGGVNAVHGTPHALPVAATTARRREQMAAYKQRQAELVRCGKQMRHATCARTAGHGGDHSSRAAMDRKAAVRRRGPYCAATHRGEETALLEGSIARVRARDGW